MKCVAIGIDVGGTNISFGVVTDQGEIIYKTHSPTHQFPIPEDFVEWISQNIVKFSVDQPNVIIQGIGVGAPNGNIHSGQIVFAPNLPWKGEISLAQMLTTQTGLQTTLTNDANAAAWGEMLYGAARGCKDFLFITLGTGLGSGIVSGGEMIYGHDGFAGEVGHMILFPEGRDCGCGRKGCVEAYCSASAILLTYYELGGENVCSAQEIFNRAQQGEGLAIQAFEQTGNWLGLVLANCVAVTSPEKIILFGGLAQAGEVLLSPTIKSFENNLLTIYRNKIPIIISQLPGNDSAILGAAALAFGTKASRR